MKETPLRMSEVDKMLHLALDRVKVPDEFFRAVNGAILIAANNLQFETNVSRALRGVEERIGVKLSKEQEAALANLYHLEGFTVRMEGPWFKSISWSEKGVCNLVKGDTP